MKTEEENKEAVYYSIIRIFLYIYVPLNNISPGIEKILSLREKKP